MKFLHLYEKFAFILIKSGLQAKHDWVNYIWTSFLQSRKSKICYCGCVQTRHAKKFTLPRWERTPRPRRRRRRKNGVICPCMDKGQEYKGVPLCENYVRDFFIATILPVSVNSSYSTSIATATYCFNLAAILAVSVMHSSSCVITRDQQAKIADTQTLGNVFGMPRHFHVVFDVRVLDLKLSIS